MEKNQIPYAEWNEDKYQIGDLKYWYVYKILKYHIIITSLFLAVPKSTVRHQTYV